MDDPGDQDLSPLDRVILASSLRWSEYAGSALAVLMVGGTSREALIASAGAAGGAAMQVAARINALRRSRLDYAWEQTASMGGLSGDELLSRVTSDERLLHLTGQVLEASTRVLEDERVRALARTVVNSIAEGDRVENERLVARALAALEPPHVQVLARLSHPQPGSTAVFARWPVYSIQLLQQTLPGARDVLDPILATLSGQGLVFVQGATHPAKRQLSITDFGREGLRRLTAEGLVVPRPPDDESAQWRRTAGRDDGSPIV